MAPPISQHDLDLALSGERSAVRELVRRLTPVIQARVARVLLRGPAAGGAVRAEVRDQCQAVFMALFADQGRVLRTWDPARGLSLENFVGLVATRQAMAACRRVQPPERNLDDDAGSVARLPSPAPGPESDTAAREQLDRLLQRLVERLSPLALQMFRLLFVEELDVEAICRRMDMTPDAVYAWRSRLRRTARELAHEPEGEATGGRPASRASGGARG